MRRLTTTQIELLSLGVDANTAVCRAVAGDTSPYLVTPRGGDFDVPTIAVPPLFHLQGVSHRFALILYPFVGGEDGFSLELSDAQQIGLGRTLKGVHTTLLPDEILDRLPRGTFSPDRRERVCAMQAELAASCF